ncbi:MAG: hypothetical protein H5T86_08030 [Armatimonadetes bacterium]|nr:hypothetical protein [Armatimonadota bacterium]
MANEQALSDEEFQELYDKVRLALHVGRLEEAAQIAAELVAARPQSTTAHELMGDVYSAMDKLEEAEGEYRLAASLEPANADAQRKLGEVVLRRRQSEIESRLNELDLAELAHRGYANPRPEEAALRSALFPGLGQLYNGDYEKGFVLAGLGLVALGFAADGFVGLMALDKGSALAPIYAIAGTAAYIGVYVYSIWDAVIGAREHQKVARLYRSRREE